MKLGVVILCMLAACAMSLAVEHGPLISALQPAQAGNYLHDSSAMDQPRQKRGLGLIGAGILGAGVLGAGALGAGIIGAKALGAGFVGGALASKAFHGRSYGGYGGYYGGHGYYGNGYGYGGYGGYGGYRTYYYPSTTYYVSDLWC